MRPAQGAHSPPTRRGVFRWSRYRSVRSGRRKVRHCLSLRTSSTRSRVVLQWLRRADGGVGRRRGIARRESDREGPRRAQIRPGHNSRNTLVQCSLNKNQQQQGNSCEGNPADHNLCSLKIRSGVSSDMANKTRAPSISHRVTRGRGAGDCCCSSGGRGSIVSHSRRDQKPFQDSSLVTRAMFPRVQLPRSGK